MRLTINLENEKVKLELTRNGRFIDSAGFSYYHDLEDKLITNLDKLLKRNRISIHSIKSYKILGNQGQETTTHKIVEAVVCGLKVTL